MNNKNNKNRLKYRTPVWMQRGEVHPLTGTYYDTAEMMAVLHVSNRTLLRWRKEGKLPFKRLGGKIYYLADALDRIMREDGDDADQ